MEAISAPLSAQGPPLAGRVPPVPTPGTAGHGAAPTESLLAPAAAQLNLPAAERNALHLSVLNAQSRAVWNKGRLQQ